MNRKILIVLVILFLGVFRLWLTDKAWHVDMWSNAGWGEWIYEHGPAKFYDNQYWTYAWPTQPPLVNSIYAFNKSLYVELLGRLAGIDFQVNKVLPGDKVPWLSDFVYWFGYGKVNIEIPYQIGYLVTMKLLPILADLGIAWLVYLITKKAYLALIFLLSPFSWYVSALWGQYDGVGFSCVLAGLTLMSKNKLFWLVPGLVVIGTLIKPTNLILFPMVGFYFLKQKNGLLQKAAGVGLALAVFAVTTAPYTHKNPFEFAWYDLKRIVFEKSEPRVSTNAFNAWRVIIGNKAVNANHVYLGIPANVWGLVIFGIINIFAVKKLQYWESLFAAGAGGFVFMTGMLDRYAYAGVVLGLILVGKQFKLLKWWILWSTIFWLNLYNQWWIPVFFEPLKQVMLAGDAFLTRILGGLAVIVFGKFINSAYGPRKGR
jgi:hypothetical protein